MLPAAADQMQRKPSKKMMYIEREKYREKYMIVTNISIIFIIENNNNKIILITIIISNDDSNKKKNNI